MVSENNSQTSSRVNKSFLFISVHPSARRGPRTCLLTRPWLSRQILRGQGIRQIPGSHRIVAPVDDLEDLPNDGSPADPTSDSGSRSSRASPLSRTGCHGDLLVNCTQRPFNLSRFAISLSVVLWVTSCTVCAHKQTFSGGPTTSELRRDQP